LRALSVLLRPLTEDAIHAEKWQDHDYADEHADCPSAKAFYGRRPIRRKADKPIEAPSAQKS